LTRTEDDPNVVTWNTVNMEYNTIAVAVTYVLVRKTDYCNMEYNLITVVATYVSVRKQFC
jgi:hypothetical protein